MYGHVQGGISVGSEGPVATRSISDPMGTRGMLLRFMPSEGVVVIQSQPDSGLSDPQPGIRPDTPRN